MVTHVSFKMIGFGQWAPQCATSSPIAQVLWVFPLWQDDSWNTSFHWSILISGYHATKAANEHGRNIEWFLSVIFHRVSSSLIDLLRWLEDLFILYLHIYSYSSSNIIILELIQGTFSSPEARCLSIWRKNGRSLWWSSSIGRIWKTSASWRLTWKGSDFAEVF